MSKTGLTQIAKHRDPTSNRIEIINGTWQDVNRGPPERQAVVKATEPRRSHGLEMV